MTFNKPLNAMLDTHEQRKTCLCAHLKKKWCLQDQYYYCTERTWGTRQVGQRNLPTKRARKILPAPKSLPSSPPDLG